jgi:hypothetical protein
VAERPKVVVLCGSTRFKTEFIRATCDESLAGHIVLGVCWYTHVDGSLGEAKEEVFRELHFRKIDWADEVLVLNPKTNCCNKCGKWCEVETVFYNGVGYNARSACCKAAWTYRAYIGESTRRAIAYARSLGKPIRWLEPAAAEE